MRAAVHRIGFLAFLDLMSCGFGAAIIIFLLAAAAESPVGPIVEADLVVVRAYLAGGGKAEIGIECRRLSKTPSETPWLREGDLDEAHSFTAPAIDKGGGEAFLILTNPEAGGWEFRAYMQQYPRKEGTRVYFKAYGDVEGSNDQGLEFLIPMRKVGDFSQSFSINVEQNSR